MVAWLDIILGLRWNLDISCYIKKLSEVKTGCLPSTSLAHSKQRLDLPDALHGMNKKIH